MHMNPANCSFGVQDGNFLEFMLMERGVEPNPDKCQEIIDVRSLANVKKVQRLAGYLSALSYFLSCAGENVFPFFTVLRKKERFEWIIEGEKAFSKVKTFLISQPILTHRKKDC